MDPLDPGIDPTVIAACFAVAVLAFAFWRYLLALVLIGFVSLTLLGFDRVWMALRG